MATQVLIAHTGQRLQIDTAQFQSYGYPFQHHPQACSLFD
jgi:hypothetical protein